jgi:arabinofuranan 3-O-arabinosyltransferase
LLMAAPALSPNPPDRAAISPHLLQACMALFLVNAALFLVMSFSNRWLFDAQGLGVPTDFVNVWSAGWLVLQGHPATAYDWDIQKQAEIAVLGRDYVGNFAWHYPPPFLFVAAFLARFPYSVAFVGWIAASLVPYLLVMRAIVGRPFGLLLAVAFPVILANTMVGQNGFLTAALIGGTLYLLPTRPILAGICLGLLSYKPQYGLLFPLALIAGAHWRAFISAAIVTVAIAVMSWLAFGSDGWHAFFHWMPMFSQAFFTEGRATWFKLQSMFGLVRFLGGSEPLAWTLQWMMSGTVVIALVMAWRSNLPYWLKAAALATGTLLATPYLFLYDQMVLAIPVALLIRTGLTDGFAEHELPALGSAALLLVSFPWVAAPVGLGATLIVAMLIARRAGLTDSIGAGERIGFGPVAATLVSDHADRRANPGIQGPMAQ